MELVGCQTHRNAASANTSSGWATPFVWMAVWAAISIPWVRSEMHRETVTWESVCKINVEKGAPDSEDNRSPPVE